eukprot:m.96232 g.96232  ORF g.96232 m.96232 type:complete len:64 (+) comp13070_c0_seq1:1534-1725(+)
MHPIQSQIAAIHAMNGMVTAPCRCCKVHFCTFAAPCDLHLSKEYVFPHEQACNRLTSNTRTHA